MDVKITKEQLNRISNHLLNLYFKDLTPIKGNVDFSLLFLNRNGEVVLGIDSHFPVKDVEKYVIGKRKTLRSYPDNFNYAHISNKIIKSITSIFPPFNDGSTFDNLFKKYFYKNYGIKVNISHSVYGNMYLKREEDFLQNNY